MISGKFPSHDRAGCCADRGDCGDDNYDYGDYSSRNRRSNEFSYSDFGSINSCKLPTNHLDIMWESLVAYESTGIVRNVIDLMSDFGSCGIRLEHPIPNVEKFYQHWWNRVYGADRSERFLNNLYKFGTAIIRRQNGVATITQRKDIQKYNANATNEGIVFNKPRKNEIPMKYTFLNPSVIDVVGGAVTALMDEKPVFGIKLPFHVQNILLNPRTELERRLVKQIPKDFLEALKGKTTNIDIIPLQDQEELFVSYYKKDDWQT